MTEKALADELRLRLKRKKLVPIDILNESPDSLIINGYVQCAGCGAVWVEKPELDRIIKECTSAEEFLSLTEAQACC